MLKRRTLLVAGLALAALAVGGWMLRSEPTLSLEEALADVLEDVELSEVPGVLFLYEDPDRRVELTRGVADRKTQAPMRMDHLMRAGSICKTYVAALTVDSARQGKLDLTAPIDTYLDAEVLAQLPDGLRPTVQQLLNHSSGVPDYYSERFYKEDWDRNLPLTPALTLHAIRGMEATHAPGTQFAYSNTNYHLIALILEAVHNRPLSALLVDRLLAPLNLSHTFYDDARPPGDDIHGYGTPFDPWEDTYLMRENSGPDGGMFMSAADLSTWLRALFAPYGKFAPIGTEMTANPLPDQERVFQGMGAEIRVSRSGMKVVGHTGGIDGYLTAGYYIPERDAVIVLHMNRSDVAQFSRTLGDLLKVIVAQPTPQSLTGVSR